MINLHESMGQGQDRTHDPLDLQSDTLDSVDCSVHQSSQNIIALLLLILVSMLFYDLTLHMFCLILKK